MRRLWAMGLVGLLFALGVVRLWAGAIGLSASYLPIVQNGPLPTPTPITGDGITILPNHRLSRGIGQYGFLTGEVRNDSGEPLGVIMVRAEVFSGEFVVASRVAEARIGYLPPGETTCFADEDLGALDITDPVVFARFALQSEPTDRSIRSYTVVESVGSAAYDVYYVNFTLRNDDPTPLPSRPGSAVFVITLYDTGGIVMGCQYGYFPPIAPGESVEYQVGFSELPYYDSAGNHRIQAQVLMTPTRTPYPTFTPTPNPTP